MHDGRFPFEVVSGVPVVTAPEEIDITNAPELRSALLERGRARARDARGRHDPDPVLRFVRAAYPAGGAQARPGRRRRAAAGHSAAAVLRVFALTGIDRMIPNFTTLDEALAQTSADGSNGSSGPNGSNGYRRADGGPERQPSASGVDERAS